MAPAFWLGEEGSETDAEDVEEEGEGEDATPAVRCHQASGQGASGSQAEAMRVRRHWEPWPHVVEQGRMSTQQCEEHVQARRLERACNGYRSSCRTRTWPHPHYAAASGRTLCQHRIALYHHYSLLSKRRTKLCLLPSPTHLWRVLWRDALHGEPRQRRLRQRGQHGGRLAPGRLGGRAAARAEGVVSDPPRHQAGRGEHGQHIRVRAVLLCHLVIHVSYTFWSGYDRNPCGMHESAGKLPGPVCSCRHERFPGSCPPTHPRTHTRPPEQQVAQGALWGSGGQVFGVQPRPAITGKALVIRRTPSNALPTCTCNST